MCYIVASYPDSERLMYSVNTYEVNVLANFTSDMYWD